jgi:hypothetical protein
MLRRSSAALLLVASSCVPPGGGTDGGSDAGGDGGDAGGDGGGARFTRPAGHASLTFFVDDRANHTYREGALYWKGTFRYDGVTNIATYDATWGGVGDGEAGPWPRLYDDGPIAAGGHEAPGQSASDDIFSAEVYVASDAEHRYDYGLANEDFNWIWPRKNGTVTVPAGSTAVHAADGLVIAGFGDIDLKLTLDLTQLHADFAGANYTGIFVKGSMNSWKAVQMDCDPAPCAYVLSESLGPHDGLLRLDEEVQFVFVFNDAQGLEYKVGGDAVLEGLGAFTDYETRGTWRAETVDLREESRSAAKNAALVVGGEVAAGEPEILLVNPSTGKAGDAITITGTGFDAASQVFFDDAEATVSDSSGAPVTLVVAAPAHAPGAADVAVRNPGGIEDVYADAFTYLDTSQTQVGWCMLEGPATAFLAYSDEATFSALVWTQGVTPGAGPGAGIEAEWARGAPSSDPSGWSGWIAATYRDSVDGASAGDLANDRLGYDFTAAAPEGEFAWSVRVRLNGGAWTYCDRTGTGDGFSSADLPRVTVAATAGLRFTPAVDGAFAEWPERTRAAVRPSAKTPQWGAANQLDALYVAYDDAKLYLGVSGKVEAGNVMLVYLDAISGGAADLTTLTDGTGQPDNALSACFDASGVSGFGADFGVGFKGDGTSGLRGFSNPADFPWITAGVTIAGSAQAGFEAALPWSELLTGGTLPGGGATVKLFVRLGNDTGFAQSDESLPPDAAGCAVAQVYSFVAQ